MRSPKSIAWRIITYLLGYFLVLFLVLWIFQIELLPAMYRNHRKEGVIAKVTELGQSMNELGFSGSVVEEARENVACIRVLRQSGTEILSLDCMPYCDLHNMSKGELMALWAQAEEGGGSRTTIYPMNSDRVRRMVPTGVTAILYVQVFYSPDHEPTAIFYNSSISPIQGMLEVLQAELRWITVAAIGVALMLALWIARVTVSPITKIIEQTRRLKEQDYTVTFDSTSYLEVARLSDLLNETSRRLEQLDQMRRALLANVSHDLRTPLSMIIAYSEIMRDIPGENTPENVQIIIDEAVRLGELVSNVLIYPDAGDLIATELQYTRFDYAALCRGIVERYRGFRRVLSGTVCYEGPDSLFVLADRTRLSQVLYNLLNNAVSHSGGTAEITLRLTEPEYGLVRTEVQDRGKGIPKEKQDLIWELNYTESDAKEYHSGMGLSIVRLVLEQHRAKYGVDSTPGEGSTFWFLLQTMQNGTSQPALTRPAE